MAISDTQKVDFLWKKLGFGATKTDVNSIKGATNEAIPSPLFLRGDKLWSDSALVPGVIPSSTTEFVQIYSDANLNTTVQTIEDITASPRRTWLTNLIDWIPPEMGSTYQVKVYVDNPGAANPETSGTRLFAAGSGNNDEWFFDYQSGVLNFIGTNLPAAVTTGKVIYISGARYIGRFNRTAINDLDDAVNINTNLALGLNSLTNPGLTGLENVALGNNSQINTRTGSYNISIGNDSATILTDGSNNIVIGANAQPSSAVVNNEVTIGNDQTRDLRMPGPEFFINDGRVLIGKDTTTDPEKLQVQGSASVSDLMTAGRFEGSIDGGEF